MNMLIACTAMYLFMGTVLTGLFVKSDTKEGIKIIWTAVILGIVCWPLFMNLDFNQWLDELGKRHIPTHSEKR